MQHPIHPDDERLAALAGGDPEVTSDTALRAHVDTCGQCAGVVRELGSLRTALAELPDPDAGEPELMDEAAPNPIAEAARAELYRHLDAALRLLPPDQRYAVVLCDVYGMDYGEVAEATASALGTVKSRIHRGRLRLRELMAEHRELFER